MKLLWRNGLKYGLLLILGWALWKVLSEKLSVSEFTLLFENFGIRESVGLTIVLLLMPLNWGLESEKWQVLLTTISPINFKQAYKTVLLGATLGNLTPLMIGDFVGRVGSLPKEKRLRASSNLLYGHGMQSLVMIFFAWLGLLQLYFFDDLLKESIHVFLIFFLLILLLIGVLFFADIIKFDKILSKFKIQFLDKYNLKAKTFLFLLSTIRHLVFGFQFIILLLVFHVALDLIVLFALVNIIFLFKTIAAFVGFWGDLIGRQLSAVYLFGLYAKPIESVLSASLLLWLINVFLPMIFGLIVATQYPVISRNLKPQKNG